MYVTQCNKNDKILVKEKCIVFLTIFSLHFKFPTSDKSHVCDRIQNKLLQAVNRKEQLKMKRNCI